MRIENTWQVSRSVLDVNSVQECANHLTSSMQAVLAELSCPETDPLLAGDWVANRLEDPQHNLADNEISILRGHFPAKIRLHHAVVDLARELHSNGFLTSIFSQQFRYLHMPPMARFVLPGNRGAGVPPHFDWQYNTHMSSFANVWVPAVPISNQCGGVTVWEAAGGVDLRTDEMSDGIKSSGLVRTWHEGVITDGLIKHDCSPMALGDVLTFGSGVLHGSMPNTSTRTRISMEFRFLPDGASSSKPVWDLKSGELLPNVG